MGVPDKAIKVQSDRSETLQDVPEIKLLDKKEERMVSAHDLTPEDLLKVSEIKILFR